MGFNLDGVVVVVVIVVVERLVLICVRPESYTQPELMEEFVAKWGSSNRSLAEHVL